MAKQKIKLVLVEDEPALSRVLTDKLTSEGFEVVQIFSGDEAFDAIKNGKPNLVLLDLLLPKKHGFDILADLKADAETQPIPVIILTALGSDDDIKKGIQLGSVDYIVKSQHAIAEIIEKIKTHAK
ncbi:MAG: response regulator [Candidatus Niyogibacteria bacterium]|nr:response regulator [Candidatus Niyogibacteria bacterium]